MTMKNQRKYPPEEIISILRQNLLEKVPVSELADKFGFHPTMFYRWQKQFFENGAAAFDREGQSRKDSPSKKLEEKISHLQAKLAHKDEVIAEIMASHVQLKKSLGEA
jgi:transposase